jgi:SWI/SNF-related matrix-associated actin-dependent regulator of chromatin subfamily A member 5
MKKKRDQFLTERMHLIKYFLPEHNYFNKRKREEEAKARAATATAAAQASAAALSTETENREMYQDSSMMGEYEQSPESNHPSMQIESKQEEEEGEAEEEPSLKEEEDEVNQSSSSIDLNESSLDRNHHHHQHHHHRNEEEQENKELSVKLENLKKSGKAIEISPLDMVEEDPAPEEEVDDPEEKIHYSTLEGVNMLSPSPLLVGELHEHQITGISWMIHMFQHGMPMILGDQMGLGKTIQTIGFLSYLSTGLKVGGPHLIIVPLSVLSNWLSEIEKFCPAFRAVRFHGPKSERERIKEEEMKDISNFEIVVTTYEILVSEINYFRRKFVWTSVVIDEGHRLKNEKSQLSEKLRLVPSISKIILTGTPLQNNLHELWALLYYLAPDVFISSIPFDEGFDLAKGKINTKILRRARRMLSVFMLRRLKEHVAIKLPSRKEVTLLVSLTEQQNELYRHLLCSLDSNTIEIVMREADSHMSRTSSMTDIRKASSLNNLPLLTTNNHDSSNTLEENSILVGGDNGGNNNKQQVIKATYSNDSEWRKLMNILLQLRKICNHSYLLPHVAPDPYQVTEEIVSGSGKLLMMDRMLPALKEDNHRVLIFSQFTSMLDILEDYCELRDYSYVRLDGETNRVKRRLDVRRFNAKNSSLFIFLISTRAGGLGLNLASADTVILYDSDWNPQVDLQAMERAHRIGQIKPVRVYRLICRGSVEERMIARAEKKLFLNAMVGEIDPDQQLSEHHKDGGGGEGGSSNSNDADSDVMEALGIGGTAMSKGELASLIRFGANAIFESENSLKNQLSDDELFILLERDGRDKPQRKLLNGSSSEGRMGELVAADENIEESAEDAFEKAQAVLKDRMEMLKEVDLHQLGNIVYEKKKTTDKNKLGFDAPEVLNEKRQRKERIVMVDGKGTGYGGSVPILSDNMDKEEPTKAVDTHDVLSGRGRQWIHRSFCTLCAKHIDIETANTSNNPNHAAVKCAHCPFLFHQRCAYEYGIIYGTKASGGGGGGGAGMFICPHHRCTECNRPTASAGGLLFRCLGCLTAYCEDCLPQDEIESIGRCRDLESQCGYHSKQAYYIKCPVCCKREGLKPTGVLGDQNQEEETEPTAASLTLKDEGGEGANEEKQQEGENGGASSNVNEEEQQQQQDEEDPNNISSEEMLLRTQYMLIKWKEIVPPPKVDRRNKKRKRQSKASSSTKKKKIVEQEDDNEDDDEEEEESVEEEGDENNREKSPYESITFLEDGKSSTFSFLISFFLRCCFFRF